MQHSTMTWADIEKMIAACPHSVATPMVRIADELESSIQHATDIGLLGIIMPTVDTVEKAQAAVRYAKYPPEGRRSMGGGQAARIWIGEGRDATMKYRTTVNDNMMVIAMIETPIGVANAYEIASVPGIDGILIANTDLANFSGWFDRESGPYQGMLKLIHDATRRAGKYLGATGPVPPTPFPRSDFNFYQGGEPIDGYKPPSARPAAGAGEALDCGPRAVPFLCWERRVRVTSSRCDAADQQLCGAVLPPVTFRSLRLPRPISLRL